MSVLASRAVRDQIPVLAERIVDNIYGRQSEPWRALGDVGRQKSVRDVGYHLTYLAEALNADEAALFNEYLAWVKVLFAGLNFPASVLPDTLATIRLILSQALTAEVRHEVLAMLDNGQQGLEQVTTILPSFIRGDEPLDQLARDFLEALLVGDRRRASEMILASARGGVNIRDIYAQVFERTQREVGRLWQINQISVAQEHFCTAATQMVISQLYPYLFTGERKERRMVMTCVGGELHEIGARMVADFFEMDGWDTYFLGANTPLEGVLRAVEEQQADLLAISVTMTYHLGHVSALIDGLRQWAGSQKPPVLVGGQPFNLSSQLWRKIGADGYATDAQGALRAAEQVMRK